MTEREQAEAVEALLTGEVLVDSVNDDGKPIGRRYFALDRNYCLVESPYGFQCTRATGHSGHHVAMAGSGFVCEEWPDRD
jgi:hypothetical protein